MKTVLPTVNYGGGSEFWFDWLVRDLFGYLIQCTNRTFSMPVTGEVISIGDQWYSRAMTAHARALNACDYEYRNLDYLAGTEWQKIFGSVIPLTIL